MPFRVIVTVVDNAEVGKLLESIFGIKNMKQNLTIAMTVNPPWEGICLGMFLKE